MCEWPKTTASASGKRLRIRSSLPPRGTGVVDHPDARARGLDHPRLGGQAPPSAAVVHVAVTPASGGPIRSQLVEHLDATKSPA